MSYGNRELQGTEERSALKLPIPVGLSSWTLNLTVPEDEFRIATIGQAVSQAVAGPHNRHRPKLAGRVGGVILTGPSSRQEG